MKVINIEEAMELYVDLTAIEEKHHVSLIEGTSSIAIVQEVNAVVCDFVASAECADVNVGRYVITRHLEMLVSSYQDLVREMRKHRDARGEIFDLSVRKGFDDAIAGYNNAVEKCDYVATVIGKYCVADEENE